MPEPIPEEVGLIRDDVRDLKNEIDEMKKLLPQQQQDKPPRPCSKKCKSFLRRHVVTIVCAVPMIILFTAVIIWFGTRIKALEEMQEKESSYGEDFSAFTADHPAQSTTEPTRLAFGNIRYQRGSGYNRYTGTFRCSTPGTYLFSASIVKKKDATTMTCHMYKNNDQLANLILDGTNYTGNTAVSATVNIDLTSGDIVYLADCSNADTTMEKWSVFAGSLLSRQ